MSIVLIGYRGSGKTSIGKRLADQLWQTFVDTDELIVKRAGKTIRAIFEQDGEPRFREIEAEAVREASKLEDHVIALGGGAPIRADNRETIRSAGHKVIYLRCEPAELLKRIQADVGTNVNRPNLTSLGGGIEEIEKVLAEREPIYREFKTAELDVTNLSPEEAVVRIARLI